MHNWSSESLDSDEEELGRIHELFTQYVAPSVIEALQDPTAFKLGGNEATVAVIVTDIRDYTSMAYKHDTSIVVEMLNEYYQVVVDAVLSNIGMLDKFMGDRCLAFFNGPVADPDFLGRSVKAALQIKSGIEMLNQSANSALYPLEVGIGLTVGPVWVGTVGTEDRREYTIIGSTTNLAFRLAKLLQETKILTTEEVIKSLGTQVKKRSVGDVQLPSGAKIVIYELL